MSQGTGSLNKINTWTSKAASWAEVEQPTVNGSEPHVLHRSGPRRPPARVLMDTTTVHLSLDGVHVTSVPPRQTTASPTPAPVGWSTSPPPGPHDPPSLCRARTQQMMPQVLRG